MTATTFTLVFLIFVALSFAVSQWLSLRHLTHVRLHRNAVPAEFSAVVSLDSHQKAADYTVAKGRVGLMESVVDVAVLLAFTLGGGVAMLHAVASGWFTNSYAQGLAIFAGLMFISSLISTPFDLYRTFVIETRFGFNKTSFKLYVQDAIKGLLVGIAIGTPLLLLTFWLMERMGPYWWFTVWLVWLGFSLLMIAIYPTFIAPLFNKFAPLADESLKARIEALLSRCGFQSKGLFIMDGSKRSSHGNAYFTGFGKGKRIVFFDTLIERLTPPEIEAVLAHELGHFKRKHIVKRIVTQFALTFLILAAMGWVIDKPWFYEGLGYSVGSGFGNGAPHVAVSLLLFFMVLPVFTFWLTPAGSLISRKHEFEADAYAASQTQASDLISALLKLYRDNASTLTPDPLHSAMYDSHPPASIRIAHLKSLGTT